MKAHYLITAIVALAAGPLRALVIERAGDAAEAPELKRLVVRVGCGSGVYLGDGWVITAHHAGCHPAVFSTGEVVQPERASWKRIGEADLAVFRLVAAPKGSFPPAELAARAPAPGAKVTVVATGRFFDPAEGYVIVNGEKISFSGSLRRERKLLAGVSKVAERPRRYGALKTPTVSFRTTSGAQVAPGDSGGGGFSEEGGRAVLAGIVIEGHSQVTDGNEQRVPLGAPSYFADIATYRTEILLAIGRR